jgi:transcriptional regulator with XRE-family HTH domain
MESGGFMEVFSSHFLKTSRKEGHPVVLATVNASPKTIVKRLGAVANHPDVTLVDGFTWGKGEGASLFTGYYDSVYTKFRCRIEKVTRPKQMEDFIQVINGVEEQMPGGTRYLFDSLTGMGQIWEGEERVLTFFTRQCPRLFELDTVAYWILEKSAHSASFRAQINHITQVAIDLGVKESIPILTLLKADGREDSGRLHPRPFQVRRSRVDFAEEGREGLHLPIGPRIRGFRLRKGMSQVELARLIGVSASTISQVEGEQILLSLPALVRAARALDVSLDTLVSPNGKESSAPIFPRDQRVRIRLNPYGEDEVVAYSLTPLSHFGNLRIYEIQLQPAARLQGHFFVQKGEELGYLLGGEVRVGLNGQEHRMLPGDVIHLIQEVPEHWVNPQESEALLLWVLRG